MMKKHLILLGVLLSSQLSMAEDLAPTNVKIVSQNDNIAWLKFKDNSDGDFFRFYFDGQPNSKVISDKKDTTWRNGKSRVVPLRLNPLAPKTYKLTIGVIKDNKNVAQSRAIDLTIGENSNQAPTISKVFKGSQRYTWVKFIDNSNADLFRFYFNGKANPEAIKDYKDTTARNGKSRIVPINITKLAPNSKFDVTIGVIKDGKKVAESKAFTIQTGGAVDLREKVIEFNKEYGEQGASFDGDIKVDFFFDKHLAQITASSEAWTTLINFYRIDDNNNIKPISNLPFGEYFPMYHEYVHLYPYDNNTKLQILVTSSDSCHSRYYDVRDLDNIILLREDLDDLSCTVMAEVELGKKVKEYDFAQMSNEESMEII